MVPDRPKKDRPTNRLLICFCSIKLHSRSGLQASRARGLQLLEGRPFLPLPSMGCHSSRAASAMPYETSNEIFERAQRRNSDGNIISSDAGVDYDLCSEGGGGGGGGCGKKAPPSSSSSSSAADAGSSSPRGAALSSDCVSYSASNAFEASATSSAASTPVVGNASRSCRVKNANSSAGKSSAKTNAAQPSTNSSTSSFSGLRHHIRRSVTSPPDSLSASFRRRNASGDANASSDGNASSAASSLSRPQYNIGRHHARSRSQVPQSSSASRHRSYVPQGSSSRRSQIMRRSRTMINEEEDGAQDSPRFGTSSVVYDMESCSSTKRRQKRKAAEAANAGDSGHTLASNSLSWSMGTSSTAPARSGQYPSAAGFTFGGRHQELNQQAAAAATASPNPNHRHSRCRSALVGSAAGGGSGSGRGVKRRSTDSGRGLDSSKRAVTRGGSSSENADEIDNMKLARSQLNFHRKQSPFTNCGGLDSGTPAHRGIVDFGRLHQILDMSAPHGADCGDSDENYW